MNIPFGKTEEAQMLCLPNGSQVDIARRSIDFPLWSPALKRWNKHVINVGGKQIRRSHRREVPTAEWTLQQFPEGLSAETPYRFVIHDRDCIFSTDLDQELVLHFVND